MRALLTAVVVFLVATPLWADVLVLRGGGRLRGVIVAEAKDHVTIDIGSGHVGISRERIAEIQRGTSALSVFQERASRVRPDDVAGWLTLGQWADDQGLATQARSAYEQVLRIDPANAQAAQALGFVQHDGRWVSEDEAFRARGYVRHEGDWITSAELAARMDERRLELERQRLEAEIAVAEAEAKAREAEAEARAQEAEARARDAEREAGVWWVAPGYDPYGYGRSKRHRTGCRDRDGHDGHGEACQSGETRRPQPPPFGGSRGRRAQSSDGGQRVLSPAERRAGR